MRTLILLFVFAIPLGAYQAKPTGSKNEKSDHASGFENQERSKDQSSPPAVSKQAIDTKPAESTSQNKTSESSKGSPDWRNTVNAASTLVIAIFTVLLFAGLVVQIRTSRAIERAWTMVDIGWNPTSSVRMANHTTGSGEEKTVGYFRMTCRNQGRSPAWIIDRKIALKIVDSVPSKPDLDSIGPFMKTPEPLAVGDPLNSDIECDCDGQANFPKITIVYGAIRYRDTFKKVRETRFGYAITPNRVIQRLEEDKYNKHT